MIDEVAKLPLEEQDRVAAAIRAVLKQPSVTADVVRPSVMEAFERVTREQAETLEYLKDK
jgi:hypothetical protein